MNCPKIEEQDILERYLQDRLTDPERDAFEQHYFACDSCFSQLQTALTVQEELRKRPRVRAQTGGAFLQELLPWTPAFAALALLLAAGVWWYAKRGSEPGQQAASTPAVTTSPHAPLPQPAPPPASLEELARVEPPTYSPVVLRDPEDEAQASFRNAMQNYLKGDYVGAIPGLRAAVKAEPRTARFSYYLGVCYLLRSQTDPAIALFQKVIYLDDPAYSQPAHFYLAKAYLRNKDVAHAEEELQTAVKLGGKYTAEATEILRQVHK